MEIHFLWIADFRSLKRTGVCLSAKYLISARMESGLLVLTIKLNPLFIPDFFKKPNITNVTAIVGQNGTGKSSILEYIKHHLPFGVITSVKNDILVYTEEDGRGLVKVPVGMEFQLVDFTGMFSEIRYEPSDLETESITMEGKLENIDYISYSFFLDFKSEPSGISGLNNISTTALLSEHRQAENQSFDFATDLDILTKSEISKAIQLLVSDKRYHLPFKRPEELVINIIEDEINYFNVDDKVVKQKNFPISIALFFKEMVEFSLDEGPRSNQINKFYLSALANFLYYQHVHTKNLGEIARFSITGTSVAENVKSFVTGFSETQTVYGTDYPSKDIKEKKQSLLDLFLAFEELVNSERIVVQLDQKDNLELVFPLNDDMDKDFRHFMNLYLRSKGFSAYLDFAWRGLSTGQQSWLSFLARINHVLFHQTGSELKKNIVVMIDEGDAGYHPEWQRMYFKHTLDFISEIFNRYKVQLIFTTNTPFLASDLTTPHVLFIKRELDKIEVLGKEDFPDLTFGANIHELFIKSFYLNGVVIGDFAKNKIQQIIDYLNDKDIVKPEPYYFDIIQQIGEPLLRRKLLDMWGQKFSDAEEERILRLRLSEIERKRKGEKGGKND